MIDHSLKLVTTLEGYILPLECYVPFFRPPEVRPEAAQRRAAILDLAKRSLAEAQSKNQNLRFPEALIPLLCLWAKRGDEPRVTTHDDILFVLLGCTVDALGRFTKAPEGRIIEEVSNFERWREDEPFFLSNWMRRIFDVVSAMTLAARASDIGRSIKVLAAAFLRLLEILLQDVSTENLEKTGESEREKV